MLQRYRSEFVSAESSDQEKIYVLPRETIPHCRPRTVLLSEVIFLVSFIVENASEAMPVSDVYRQCVNTCW